MYVSLIKKLSAEFLGTFCLIFLGTGAMVVSLFTDGLLDHVGVSLVWGFVVMVMIYALGSVSGAHINPAVSIGFFISGRMSKQELIGYIIFQILGALAGSLLLLSLFPNTETLGGTFPAGSAWQAFVIEVMSTFILMYVILSVSTGSREEGIMAGAAVGCTIASLSLVFGPITGASMNPARSIGPAVASLDLSSLWIYLTAPVLGAVFAVVACRCVREDGCCSTASTSSPESLQS